MSPDKGDAAYLWDMLDAAKSIVSMTKGMTIHVPELLSQLEKLTPTPPN
jgi:uncharacterized protein with HEPN domain